MHRRSFLAGLGLSPLGAVAAVAAPVQKNAVQIGVTAEGAAGDEHIRNLAREGARRAIGEYHEAQMRGGFERAASYQSRRG
ncbi:hypothetical protein NKH69_00155 [Mesorhizobium sp. M0976]|uniref:hypothetical protein n=1 Tax=Mesorhizobium sp. M0976 TaxID=2957038 RepID=UPI00333ABCC1